MKVILIIIFYMYNTTQNTQKIWVTAYNYIKHYIELLFFHN